MDEHLDFNDCTRTLADAAGRALGSVISKFKLLRNVGYQSFTKLFRSGVVVGVGVYVGVFVEVTIAKNAIIV